jgi:VanZ family protein
MIRAWIRQWGPAVLLMGLIFIASATPGSDLPKVGRWDHVLRKGGHMIGYALLACAFLHALDRRRNATRIQVLSAAFLALLYAASDELHQRFTPGRTPSFHDILVDLSGVVIGLAVLMWDRKRLGIGRQKPDSGT